MINPNDVLRQRQFVSTAINAPFWAGVNFLCFFLFYLEFKLGNLSTISSLRIIENVLKILEIFFMFLFLINFLYNSYIFIWFKRFLQPIQLTSEEFRLFGIDENENGFKLKDLDSKESNVNDSKDITDNKSKIPSISKFEISNYDNYSNDLSNYGNSSLDLSASLSLRFNDSNSMYNESLLPTRTPWPSPSQNQYNINESFTRRSSPGSCSFKNNSLFRRKQSDQSVLRYRRDRSFINNSFNKSLSPNNSGILSTKDLEHYLDDYDHRQDELEELYQAQKRYGANNPDSFNQSLSSSFSSSIGANQVMTSPIRHHVSFSDDPNFRHQQQQQQQHRLSPVITRSLTPPSTAYKPAIILHSAKNGDCLEKSESFNASTRLVEKILAKLNVDDVRLNQMVENIRKWISQTILVRLCNEIDSINKSILEKGYIDSMIGETSLKQLRQLIENRRKEFPTLEQVYPFLDVTNIRDNIENTILLQEYLVKRIKDLAKGGCMIEYVWDNGGNYNYHQWKPEQMLTDAELVLHLFCTYMDSRLLFDPALPEGKPFSSQHFRMIGQHSSSATNTTAVSSSSGGVATTTISSSSPSRSMFNKSDTYIQQETIYPPHYSLVLKGENFAIPPGRNNLFYTLLIFIHHIKVKNFGLLGRINLGSSGLNIAWVIE